MKLGLIQKTLFSTPRTSRKGRGGAPLDPASRPGTLQPDIVGDTRCTPCHNVRRLWLPLWASWWTPEPKGLVGRIVHANGPAYSKVPFTWLFAPPAGVEPAT